MRLRFENCVLEPESYRFERDGQPVALEPQVFDVLRVLAENAGKLVSKDQLIAEIWAGRAVSEATISARISAARSAVGDTGQAQRVIQTRVRLGFEMVVPVAIEGATGSPSPVAPHDAPLRQRIRYASSADGARIAWAESGSGPPVLRAGHHVTHLERDWHSRIWRPEFEGLSGAHRLIRFDIRGSGLSDPAGDADGMAEAEADLAAVADAAGLETFGMIATLQATPIAIRYIVANPGRVSRLVIQCGYARGRAMREDAPDDQGADPSIALLQQGWGDPTNGFMRAWTSMFLPETSREELTEFIELLGAACPPEHIAAQRRVVDRVYAADLLDRVDVPTLVIHPRRCAAHPLSEGQLLARSIPNAELMVIESANVVCMPSEPAWPEQMEALLRFLSEV